MATFALIHGGGGSAWDSHLVIPALQEHEHDAVDLPSDEESSGAERMRLTTTTTILDDELSPRERSELS
jgi:hypothetical protein